MLSSLVLACGGGGVTWTGLDTGLLVVLGDLKEFVFERTAFGFSTVCILRRPIEIVGLSGIILMYLNEVDAAIIASLPQYCFARS